MRKYLLTIITILAAIHGHAQVIEQLSPQEKKQLTVVTEPFTMYKGFLRAGLSTNVMFQDKNFDASGDKINYETNSSNYIQATILSLRYGITDRLELEGTIPMSNGRVSGSYTQEIPGSGVFSEEQIAVKYNGLADAMAILRYTFWQNESKSLGAVVSLGGYIPTGKNRVTNFKNFNEFNAPVAKGEPGLFSEFRIRKIQYPFSIEFGVAYSKFFGAEKQLEPEGESVKVVSGSEFLFRPQVNFHLNDWVVLTHYLDYYRAAKDDYDGVDVFLMHNKEYEQWVMRYYPGISFQVKRLRLEQVVQIPLKGKIFSADPAFYFSAAYIF